MTRPTTCHDCGQRVRLNSQNIKMNIASSGDLLFDAHGHRIVVFYVKHVCADEDIARWKEQLSMLLDLFRQFHEDTDLTTEDYVDLSNDVLEIQQAEIAEAMTRPCPRCGVDKWERCENLIQRRRGIKQPNKNPHSERYPEIGTTQVSIDAIKKKEDLGACFDLLQKNENVQRAVWALERILS